MTHTGPANGSADIILSLHNFAPKETSCRIATVYGSEVSLEAIDLVVTGSAPLSIAPGLVPLYFRACVRPLTISY